LNPALTGGVFLCQVSVERSLTQGFSQTHAQQKTRHSGRVFQRNR
jgi:hypothetical protein